jgi:hypothetical protein
MNQERNLEMQQPLIDRKVLIDDKEFNLRSLDVPMFWSEGSIKRPELDDASSELLIATLPKSIVRVDQSDINKSGCTDGRLRASLLDGTVPGVWQKTVGADIMEMVIAAETLGSVFYGDKLDKAPFMDRLNYVIQFMKQNQLTPTTHEGCGARVGFTTIVDNAVSFAADDRTAAALSERISVFGNQTINRSQIQEVTSKWANRDFTGYDESKVRELIIQYSGESAVKIYKTDDTQNHGHNEGAIFHIDTPGMAFSTREYSSILAEQNPELSYIQAFSVNDDRINDRLAPTIADDETHLIIAKTAMHLFADAGHATLSTDLPTYVLRKAA